MPKGAENKKKPCHTDPYRKPGTRKNSVRHAEYFDDLVEKFESIKMSGTKEVDTSKVGAVDKPPPQEHSTETDKVANGADKEDTPEVESLVVLLTDLRKRREKPRRRLQAFSSVTGVSRTFLLNSFRIGKTRYHKL